MKRINYLLMSVFAIAIMFVACDDDNKPVETTVTITDNYSIEGAVSGATNTNVELYKGITAVKMLTATDTYSFTELESAAYTVKATASGYIEQHVGVEFRKKTSHILNFAMVKTSTQTKPIDEVAGKETKIIITNDAPNQSESAAVAAITVLPATTITNKQALTQGATFSVTAYVPATATSEVTEGSNTEASAVLALNCEPSGAQFSQPVILSVDMKEQEIPAANIKLVSGSNREPVSLKGTVYSAPVTKFSTWSFQLEAPVNISAAITETTEKTQYLNKGKNTISYEEMCGYEIVNNPFAASKIVSAFIATRFGAKVKHVTKNFAADVSANGTLLYNVKQNYKTATITIGGKTISVKIYDSVSVETTGFKVGK